MSPQSLTFSIVSAEHAPMELLLEADPSTTNVRAYLDGGHCVVAERDGEPVGVYVLQERHPAHYELMNIAVRPALQAQGIGTVLLHHAIDSAGELGARTLEVGTGTFGYQLAFYQRAGFRVDRIDKDFFLNHHDEPIFEDGIQLKDMLRLVMSLPLH